jgi:hypothetical protein
MRRILILSVLAVFITTSAFAGAFKAGFAKRDVTPTQPMPMWGYGARHALPGMGAMSPLFAKALVLDTGDAKVALVGLDIGRSPTHRSMDVITEAVKTQSGVDYVMISGSHTHHGPVLELLDEPGLGKGAFDYGVAYVKELEQNIIGAINEAASGAVEARIGWVTEDTDLNRNRVSKRQPKPRDPELAVLRVDTLDGKPIALMVNLAGHAVLEDIMDRRWSGDWPAAMQRRVEEQSGINCFFMQGASGDLSPNTNEERRGPQGFGNAAADKVLELNQRLETRVPEHPGIKGIDQKFSYPTRLDLTDKLTIGVFKQGFFPELMAMMVELPNNTITVRLVTVLVNGELALVGGSGEFFSELAVQLKQESKAKETLFFGYCNGHQMYVPSRAAVAEGGYGADPMFAWVPVGTGEELIATALKNIETLLAP